MKISLIMTTFQRDHLLKLTLPNIVNQRRADEIILVNDGTPDDTEQIAKDHGCNYIFTGQRNVVNNISGIKWRVPGYALNIGVRASTGDIIILSCAEMYHIGDLLNQIAIPVIENYFALGIPEGKDDDETYLSYLTKTKKHNQNIYEQLKPLNVKLPFLLAMRREIYIEIGGYDEDFTGQAYDDNDIMSRLLIHGCEYVQTKARCVHLFHKRSYRNRNRNSLEYNKRLFLARQGVVKRNIGKEWGIL